ncbi:hypothetical protein BGX30_001351 [Mortierella sp. GBA39]|nr:hypothetical protein BGX30_001351 [Mortierella sp. GBA39]
MGIGDTFQLLEEKAFVPTPCNPLGFVPQGNKTGHVDVLAWMRQYLIATYCNILFKLFKEDRLAGRVDWNRSLEDDVARIASERLSDALKKQLTKTFIPGNVLLHIDGQHSGQKAYAHSIRASNSDKDKRAFYHNMAKVKTLMGPFYGRNIPKPRPRTPGNTRDDDDDTPTDRRVPYSARHNVFRRSTKDKIVKIRKTMKALWKKAHPMDDNIKRVTCAALNNLGHNVHSCRGEADVCISTQGGEIYSFSGDSDFLYHPIHTFVRKDPKDPTTMLAYPTQEARASFNLTPAGMAALAVVSRNDYSVHVRGYSLKKNLKVFQSINGAKPSDAIHLSSEVLGWMSSNKYRIRNYTIPSGPSPSADGGDADQHQNQKKKKKKKGGRRTNKKQKTEEEKLKEEAVKREKAAARRRPDTSKKGRTEPNPNATPKNDDPATILDRVLKGKYALNVLEVGTVGQRLKDSIAFHCRKNLPEVRERIFNDLNDFFLALVKIATDVVHAARIALSCYIAKVMFDFPANTQAEIIARKNKLQDIGDIGGKHWFGSVLNAIFRWDQGRTEKQVVREIVGDYRALYAQAGLVHNRWTDLISGGMSSFLRQVGDDMESTIQGHFFGNIKELVERVKTTNPTWCQGEGAPLLNDMYVDPTNPKNDKHMFRNYGIVAAFWTLNAHLPSYRRFALFPKYKHKDLYVTITEKHIMEALPFRPNTSPATLAFLGPFTVRSVIAHPGELVYRLFMTSTVGYKKTSCLMNPSQSGPDFPPFFLPPSVDCDDFQDAYDALQSEYEIRGNRAATPAFSQAKRNFISAIDKAIMEAKDIRSAINDDDKNKERHRRMHILHGSIQTNGLDAKLHAFHTAQKKHLAGTYVPKTTKSLLGDIKTKYPSRDELLRNHLSPEVYRIVAMDPGLANTITAVILDSRSPNRVRNLAISSASQKEPERHYRRGLNAAKHKRGINFLENSIVPVEFPQFRNTGDDWVNWLCLRDSIRLNCVSELGVYKRLRAFYGSIMFKVKNRSLKLAQNATLNKAVGVIIRSCGIKGKWREGDNKVRPLFVAGDGNFTSRPGRPIRHLQFFKKLKTKLEALGYVIVSADEYFTSKSCCQCHTKSEDHITMDRRSIQCTQYNRARDRDHNGAHNMARAALQWMTVFSWPQELCRPTPSSQPQP